LAPDTPVQTPSLRQISLTQKPGSSDRPGGRAAEAACPTQPHHRPLNLARTIDGNLNELAGVRVAIVGLTLGALDLEGFSHLWGSQFDDNAFSAEVGKDLPSNEEAVLGLYLVPGDVFPGTEALYNRLNWGRHSNEGDYTKRPATRLRRDTKNA